MLEKARLAARQRVGTQVFLGLTVLTVVEYVVAIAMSTGTLAPLALIAICKAWLIARYFMHVAQLWRHEEDEHA